MDRVGVAFEGGVLADGGQVARLPIGQAGESDVVTDASLWHQLVVHQGAECLQGRP